MTPFAASEEFDDLGRLQRTCSSDVSVNKCEGACTSQVQPSVITPTGFLKARSGSNSSTLILTLLLPTGHRNSYIDNVQVIRLTYLIFFTVTVFKKKFSGWKSHHELKIHKHFRDKRHFSSSTFWYDSIPSLPSLYNFDLESTLSLAHAGTVHETDQMPHCIRRLKVERVYFSEILMYLKQLMHLLAWDFLLNNPYYTWLCELNQGENM